VIERVTETAAPEVGPIVREVVVRCPLDRAFEVFTADIDSWWPLPTHSIGGGVEHVTLEKRVGGRIYEGRADGSVADWGTILEWQPPTRLRFDWRVNPENPATEVEVVFAAIDAGTTRVTVEHRGWEQFDGPRLEKVRDSYGSERGWTTVMRKFAAHAEA